MIDALNVHGKQWTYKIVGEVFPGSGFRFGSSVPFCLAWLTLGQDNVAKVQSTLKTTPSCCTNFLLNFEIEDFKHVRAPSVVQLKNLYD